ncbi:hypothetical protein [Moraxella cuniculi]|uniref:Uncharacterized protein n=1 Tax=Moraxella cuniculi TaxID=34061 RepID=A0A448GX59_9GAMM|nr:hypothetical protein [Moraxella cuniculi]VEG13355.1 Uncharacterised protein [Moraxella cuniculi]
MILSKMQNIKKATDEFLSRWYSNNPIKSTEGYWYIEDIYSQNILNNNVGERIISCYWNNDVLLIFSGKDCSLNSIIVCGNYYGKLLGNVSIGDNLIDVHKIYNFEFYADTLYLMHKDEYDEVIGAEIMTNYLSDYSDLILDQIILAIGIYSEQENG